MEDRECSRCGDEVAYLSTGGLCDGCTAEEDPPAALSPLAAVCAALTGAERTAIETGFTDANPHWQGAHAADILEALYDHDAHLVVREPFAEANPGLPRPAAAYAELALIRLGRPLTAESVGTLLDRAGLA